VAARARPALAACPALVEPLAPARDQVCGLLLDATIERLKRRRASFKGSVFTDQVLGARSILLLDNSDNVIQLFERHPAK